MNRRRPFITLYDATYITVSLVVFLAALMAIVVWSARPANAQGLLCAPWTEIKAKFAAKYGEVPTSSGVVTDKLVIQILASRDGKTWSLVVINSDGRACVTAAGKDWDPGVLPISEEPT